MYGAQVLRAHTAMLERRCAHYEVCMQGGETPSFWPSSLGSSWAGAKDRDRDRDSEEDGGMLSGGSSPRYRNNLGLHARGDKVLACLCVCVHVCKYAPILRLRARGEKMHVCMYVLILCMYTERMWAACAFGKVF